MDLDGIRATSEALREQVRKVVIGQTPPLT